MLWLFSSKNTYTTLYIVIFSSMHTKIAQQACKLATETGRFEKKKN